MTRDDKNPYGPLADTLSGTLRELKDQGRTQAPILVDQAEQLIARLRTQRAGQNAPAVGDTMPEFVLADRFGKLKGLRDFLATGPALIVFLRGNWCPYCSATKRAMDDSAGYARENGISIIGISPERSGAFGAYEASGCQLLVDADNGYALALGLLIWLDDALAQAYKAHGYDISADQVGSSWMLPIPAAFLVDQDGKIASRHLDVDFRERLDLADFLRNGASL